jgi:iron(III) transport system ATP-binding protein
MLVPGQPSIEFSQDLGHAEQILEVGDKVRLKPNAAKINLFAADGSHSLMKGVVQNE